jgi:hypothetical protein
MSRDTDTKLREQYSGVLQAVPDAVLTLEKSRTLHLPARDRDGPACCCQPDREWDHVDTRDAIRFGGELCHDCFRLYFEHRSRDPGSPVERVDTDAAPDPNPELVTHATADGGHVRLTALTEEVGRSTGGGSVYHAPTGDGSALCGVAIDIVSKRELVESHFEPCSDCFGVED